MNATLGELATRWTVRAALGGYFVGAALDGANASRRQLAFARAAWSLGCLCYLAHVASAFHYFHHWSHAAAVERTADQTDLVIGWRWGGGLYVNYLFTGVWLADTIAKWLPWPGGKPRPRWLEIAIQAFMWFMVFNATVVFGHGPVRWFGLVGCLWLLAVAGQRFATARHNR